MPAPSRKNKSKPTEVPRLAELNAELDPKDFTVTEMEQLIGANPPQLRIVSEDSEATIYATDIVFREALLKIKGFSKDSLADLREIGFIPRKLSREHFFLGRHVIALFEGNLKVMLRLEELRRHGTATRQRKKS